MPHLTQHTARTHTMHGVTFTSFAASHSGATSLAAWRADFDPHTPGQPHRMSREEILHVLDGQLEIEIDDEAFTAASGDAVLIPPHATFRVSNDSDLPATAWVTTTLGMTATMARDGAELSPPWAQ